MAGGSEQEHNLRKIKNVRGKNIADFFGAIFLWTINFFSITLNNNFNQQSSSLKM